MTAITGNPIDVNAALREVATPASGGIDLFIGTVRDQSDGVPVSRLVYSAYVPMAENMLRRIEREILDRWVVHKVLMIHRIGTLRVGDVAVVTAVSASHRAEAFEACRYAIERIKADVPIWKSEESADASEVRPSTEDRRP